NSRLRLAGSDGQPIFTSEAVSVIHRYSQGIPRVVNVLCEHSLISAFADQRKPITPEIVQPVAEEFDLLESEAPASAAADPVMGNPKLAEALEGLATLMDRLRRTD
ncbi:MAG: hypothetical protein ACRD2B_00840, partial [Terriglobia bacterium]